MMRVSVTSIIMAAGLLLAAPLPGRAAENAGTRSIFSVGAGNRALGLGGAYTALSDDASAALWNPGGLGFIDRKELQATHSGLLGFGMSEQFAGFVLPDWRWGTFSLTFRRFGVDGIEERDSRNAVTDTGLGDEETEVALSYGRTMGESWSLGGALKLQRQSLAGFSAGGVGADVGILVLPATALDTGPDWLRRARLGLSVRNIVEPSLKLDQESVTDPMTVRLGLSVDRGLGFGRNLIAAVDLEKAARMDPRIHAGVEFRPHTNLALRTGVAGAALTAGTGLVWNNMALDYTYESGEIGGSHRFGLSMLFGSTTVESRAAAHRAQEEELQARLDSEFERKQQERYASLMADAEASRVDGRFEEALDRLAVAATFATDMAPIEKLESRVWSERALRHEASHELTEATLAYRRALDLSPGNEHLAAAYQRCLDESDRRSARSEEIRRRMTAGLDLFTRGDLVEARELFEAILAEEPGDADANDMLRRTRDAIERQADARVTNAARYTEGGLLDEAARALTDARRLNPGANGLGAAEAALARARRVEAAEKTPAPVTPRATAAAAPAASVKRELSGAERREIEDLYRKGQDALAAGRSEEALRYLDLVFSKDPEFEQVRDHLKREYLMKGMDAFAAGKLTEAIGAWQKALKADPNDKKAQAYLVRAQQQLSRTQEIRGQ